MFTTFLKEISGYFDRRFILSAFFPTLAFAGLSLAMCLALWGPQVLIERWQAQSEELKVLITIGTLSLILFGSYLFHVFQTNLTRLYEGYWESLPLLSWWGNLRRAYYQDVWEYLSREIEHLAESVAKLENAASTSETPAQRRTRKHEIERLRAEMGRLDREWFLFFPPQKSDVMPTRLGNILRASEFYPLKRYKLDAVVAWPRLQSLLPKEFADTLRDSKASLDLLLVITTLAGLFALGWEIGLGLLTERWDLFLLASLAWLLAVFGYSGALQAARSYAELIKAAFDLHRWELLKALHLKMPASYEDERKLWEEVSELLYRNYPPKPELFPYDVETKPPETPAKPGLMEAILTDLVRWLGLADKSKKKE
jgi:hypothetical protein